MYKNRKNLIIALLLMAIFLVGCGSVSRQTVDIGEADNSKQQVVSMQVSEQQVVQSIRGFADLQAKLMAAEELDGGTEVNSAGMAAKSLSDHDSTVPEFWEYSSSSKKVGDLNEVTDSQYRYWDKRTGQPFKKPGNTFNHQDVRNIDFIERYQRMYAYYDGYEQKSVYDIRIHEKVIDSGDRYIASLWQEEGAMDYIGVNWDTLRVKSRDIVIYKNTGVVEGSMQLTFVNRPEYSGEFIFSGSPSNYQINASVMYKGGRLVSLALADNMQPKLTTTYYVGAREVYKNLSQVNGGLEDNAVLTIMDSNYYNVQSEIDGTKQFAQLDGRLMNLTIKSAAGNYAEYKKLTVSNVDNLTIEDIKFTEGVQVKNSSKVTVNGKFYEWISDRTFKLI